MSEWEDNKLVISCGKEPLQIIFFPSHINTLYTSHSPLYTLTLSTHSLWPHHVHSLTLSSHSPRHHTQHTCTHLTLEGWLLPGGRIEGRIAGTSFQDMATPPPLFSLLLLSTYPPLCEGWVCKRYMYTYTQVESVTIVDILPQNTI